MDLLSPTPDSIHRPDHARLPGALTLPHTHTSASQDPCDGSASAPPLLTAVAVLGSLEARHHTHSHIHTQTAPISGIASGDRLYLRHLSTRLLPSRYMQIAVSPGRYPRERPRTTSIHTRYRLPLRTPPNQQTPRNHCASYAIPSRWERRRDLSWCMQHQPSGSRQHQMARHPPTSAVKQNTTRLLRLIMSAGGALQTMRSLLLVTLSHLDSYAEDHPRVRSLAPRSC